MRRCLGRSFARDLRGVAAVVIAGLSLAGRAAAATSAESPKPMSASAAAVSQSWTYDAKNKRDPFTPLVKDGRIVGKNSDGGPSAVPALGGILWDPNGHSIALINSTESKIGDTVNGYRVAEISRDEVVLTRDDERVVLRISFEERAASSPSARREERGHP